MNSAFQRIKSDPNLLIPYVLAILSGGVLVMLILWRVLSADAGVPPPVVAKDAPTSIVLPTRTAVVLPTPTPEQQLPQPLVPGNPILPAPDIGTAVPNDQTGSGLETGPTPDINSEDYENRVALPAPNNPDTNLQPGSPLATPLADVGTGQPGFPVTNPTQGASGPGKRHGSGSTAHPGHWDSG